MPKNLPALSLKLSFQTLKTVPPIPPSFPTPCTYWRHGGWTGVSTPPPVSPTPNPNGLQLHIGDSPILLNISEELEQQLLCPITQEVMFDPWIDNEGYTYEYAAIMAHLARSKTSPITRSPMFPTQ